MSCRSKNGKNRQRLPTIKMNWQSQTRQPRFMQDRALRQAMEREIELKKQLAKRRYVDPAEIAYDYAHLGDAEQTFAWLEKARAEKSGALENIKIVRPEQWHSDPRYSDLLKQLGLPQ
jgi:hypothetical protein